MRPLAIAVLTLLLESCAGEVERPNVLLISIDTLRADRLSCAGYARRTTPNLDRLAAEGVRFTHVETPRAKTTPAIASLMTGRYPHAHGARDLLMPLDARLPLLAETFRDSGYATGAIVGNYVLQDRYSGLKRGFDLWCEDLPQVQGVPPDDVPQRTARSLTDGALAALGLAASRTDAGPSHPMTAAGVQEGARAGRPWFLWLHYMDPHGLYDPPAEHRIFHRDVPDPIPDDPGPASGDLHRFTVADYNVPAGCRTEGGRVDAALVRDLYDGEVHYVDAEIGRLLDALRSRGVLEKTIVVVVADHGESLGEHHYWFEHGRDAYEATCRVPLIVRFPATAGSRPDPGVRHGDLSLADLAPTILDWLRLPSLRSAGEPADGTLFQGVSRRTLFDADDPVPRPVFAEKVDLSARSGAIQSKAVRIGDWKLIRRYTQLIDKESPAKKRLVVLSEELYDLASDPGETVNRRADPPADAPLARLDAELVDFAAADVPLPDDARLREAQREKLEREDREALRVIEALGY